MAIHFTVGNQYSRKDIYNILDIPHVKGGNWDTGYNRYNNDWFIFCNLNTPGRTGDIHDNRFIGNELVWHGKARSHLSQPTIQSMINPIGNIHIFTRDDSDNTEFTYRGNARAKEQFDTTPVKIIWSFNDPMEFHEEILPEEVLDVDAKKCKEGATKLIRVNIYERSPDARQKCIEHYGLKCVVCQFDFESHYGEIGRGFTHVHHLKPLYEIQGEYEVDPIKDLRPICPNCHAMLHKRNPTYSIEELREMISKK